MDYKYNSLSTRINLLNGVLIGLMGGLLNIIAISLNGGFMPVNPVYDHVESSIVGSTIHKSFNDYDYINHLFLVDNYYFELGNYFFVFSIGDFLIIIGVLIALFNMFKLGFLIFKKHFS